MYPYVILGDEQPAGATFAASGCSTMLDFVSSPLVRNGGNRRLVIRLSDELPSHSQSREGWLYISAKGVREREEAREAGSFARFLHALPTSCTHLFVSGVQLIVEEELSALCSAIGSPLCTLFQLSIEHLTLSGTFSSADAAAQSTLMKNALYNNTSLGSLSLYVSEMCSLECVMPALTAHSTSAIQHLDLGFKSPDVDGTLDGVSGILRGLAHNTISLTKFRIANHIRRVQRNISGDIWQLIGTMLRNNTSLKSLSLYQFRLPGKVLHMLFASLEQNARLTSLSLTGCGGPDWPSASFVLDSLRVNGTLSELDLSLTPLHGKNAAAIAAQLARNKQRGEQVATLKAEGSALVPPTTVRLFLCGLPYSGKTTLSRSLVRWNSSSSTFAKYCLSCAQTSVTERTRGIEVSSLEKDGVKVSLWDLAGQPEYYAFHDHMFPNLSNDETPSLFLFVWNPIKVNSSTGKEIKDERGKNAIKTLEMFELEFRYWLRFITSKTLKSLKFKPKLFVAITRGDLLQFNIRSYIQNSFNKCENDFQEHIQFDMDGVFEMNARDPCEVNTLALYIFHFVTSFLKSKPLVYQACNQARRVLAELVHSKPLPPLVTKQEFFSLCKKHLGLDSIEMQEAVALSLNESGDLIYFKLLELVVVDSQWFCHHFMGDLLYFSNNTSQHRGFFPPQHLEDLLESKVNSTTVSCIQSKANRSIFAKAKRSLTIKGEALVKLLIGMQIACQRDDGQANSDIFIPASLCTKTRKKIDPCRYLKGDEGNIKTFMGRRLKCKDSICTFFTPGIFSTLQVTFNNIFSGVEVTLDEDVIAFSQNGVKVLVEFCKHEGRDHFIDVLIHSRLDLDNTIGWAYEEILDKIEDICAQPRGIQGVQLVYEVIRPRSVKEFVCMEERIYTAVSFEELSKKLRHALEKRGTQPDCLQSVFHDWHPTNDSDSVIDLLGNVEAFKVIKEYRQKFILEVEDVLAINVAKDVCSTSEPKKRVFSSTVSGTEREWIYEEVRGVRKDIQEVHKEIQKLVDDVQKLGSNVLPEVIQRVKELMTFAKDGEVGKLPRLFVVTKKDANFGRKLVGTMVPGLQNVRLELLCEHRSRPHLVTEQHGISFATLEDGLLKRGLPYINMFLKLAGMAVKVGAHVVAGLGNIVPDFGRLLTMVIDTPEFPTLPTHLDLQTPGASRMNFQESQQWLFDVLSKHNCHTSTRIREVFGLYRVRYHDSHVGWLCDEHYSEGELYPI